MRSFASSPSGSFSFPLTLALLIAFITLHRWYFTSPITVSLSSSSSASSESTTHSSASTMGKSSRPTICPACSACPSPVTVVEEKDDDDDNSNEGNNACPTPVTCPTLPPPPSPPPSCPSSAPPSSDSTLLRTSESEELLRQHIRESTTQCQRTYFDVYPEWILAREVLPEECPNILASIEGATRERRTTGEGGYDLRGYPNREPANARTFSAPPIFNPPCKLRWYTPHEACDLIAEHNHLIFSGDSLVRHIVTALYGILRNNYRYGGVMNPNNIPVDWSECTCDGQFGGHSGCHRAPTMIPEFPEMVWESWSQTSLICPKWHTNRLHFLPAFGTLFDDDAVQRILSHATINGGATWYHSNGIGYIPDQNKPENRIDTETAFRLSWNKTITYATQYNNTRLIFGTVLAHEGTYPCQKREGLDAYNDWLKSIAAEHKDLGIELFDGRKIMQEMASYDLVHFLSHDNVFLAQLFLNVLAKGPQHKRTRPAVVNVPIKGKHFRDFPLQFLYDQTGLPVHEPPYANEPETSWYVGPEYDLRGCRCYKDWMNRMGTNTSICHCHGWCPPHVNPIMLTEQFPTSCRDGGYADCFYTCKNNKEEWYKFMCQPTPTTGVDLNIAAPCGYPFKSRTVSKGIAGITESAAQD